MIAMFITPSTNKWYLTTSAILFTIICIAHLALILWQMPATFGAYVVPFEINALIVLGTAYLAIRGFMAANRL
jgi:hypothetical protein